VVILFAAFRPRVAVLIAYLGGWLFLPMAEYEFAGFPGYGKMEAASYGVIVGMAIFGGSGGGRVRVCWMDAPILVWFLAPMASSLSNGLGAYEGASGVFGHLIGWGIPYWMGRLLYRDAASLRLLSIGIIVGGLVYVPLCLFEIRMSPRLHLWVYGFLQHEWRQSRSLGGWRPTVFMQHGLAVGMWMTTCSVIALGLWWTGTVPRLRQVPMACVAGAMIVTTVMCKSAGAIGLLAVGAAVIAVGKKVRSAWVVGCIAVLPVIYMGVRAPGVWDGAEIVALAHAVVPDKDESLLYRIEAENILSRHALRRPLFGWGGHSRNRPSEMGVDVKNVAPDGLWIITLGQHGCVGLVAMTMLVLLPVFGVIRRFRYRVGLRGSQALLGLLSIILTLFMIDCLFNAMFNPIYVVIAGGVVSACAVLDQAGRCGARHVE
jgi:hypothetical protein